MFGIRLGRPPSVGLREQGRVPQSLRVGEHAHGANVCDTHTPRTRKKKRTLCNTTRGYAHTCTVQPCTSHVKSSVTHSFIHSDSAQHSNTVNVRSTLMSRIRPLWLNACVRPSFLRYPAPVVLPLVVLLIKLIMTTNGAQSTFPSVTNVGRDLLWESAVASLPPPLAEALRAFGLDVGVPEEYAGGVGLCNGPHTWWRQLPGIFGCHFFRNFLSYMRVRSSSSSPRMARCVCGRRPENRPCFLDGRRPKKTDQASLMQEKGGDPRTDHASLCAPMVDEMAATCSLFRPEGAGNPNCHY